jgi:serine/threonine protein kinase
MLTPNTVLQKRYRIVRQLGQGGMGTVYEAKALRLNTTVALKETHFTDERLRKQFECEAQLLAGLRHPALPRVIDHFDEGDGLYLVMDYVEGEDLWGMLKKRGGGFPVNTVLAWAEQLLDALHYLHAQNPPVIHRDIKLQNLKISVEGKIILLDFGLAKGLADSAISLQTTRTVMGFSLPYAPLEQILQIDESWREHLAVTNPSEVERLRKIGTNHRSDLYSTGATLLHLLTGKIPTNSPTRAISIWSGRPDPLEHVLSQEVPNSLWSLFNLAMALDPGGRFRSASEMCKALDYSVKGGEDTVALGKTLINNPSDNDLQEEVSSQPEPARDEGESNLTETQKLQLAYWTAFKDFLQKHGSFISPPKPLPQHWMPLAIGRSYFRLSAFINTLQRRPKLIAVDLGITGSDAKPHFHLLHRDKEAIENEIGEALEWGEKPNNKESYIRLKLHNVDPTNPQDWSTQHEWLQEKLELFHKVFAPRIRALRVEDYPRDDNDQIGQESRVSIDSATTLPTASSIQSFSPTLNPYGIEQRRSRLLTGGFIVIALLIVMVSSFLLFANKITPNGMTNTPAQPYATPTAQPIVLSTPQVAPSPINSATNLNKSVTPTKPTPQTNGTIRAEPESGIDKDIREIDRKINQLEQKRATLLITYTPEWPEIKKIDKELQSLKRQRALKELEK